MLPAENWAWFAAGLLEAASDDAAEPAAGPVGAPALALPEECPAQAAPVEDQADAQHLAAGRGDDAGDVAEEPQPEAAQQQDGQVAQSDAASVEAPQECPLPDQLLDTCSGTDSAGSAEHTSGSSSPAEPAGKPAEAADAAVVAASQDPSAAAAGFAAAVSVAAGPDADTSGHRRRRWRRIAPRPQAPSPPGTAPASPLQRSPRQLSPAPLTGDNPSNSPVATVLSWKGLPMKPVPDMTAGAAAECTSYGLGCAFLFHNHASLA